MLQNFKLLNSEQKLILCSNLVVSAIITMMLAFFMNPGGDFSILGWIRNHLWSILPAFINVFVWNHYQIQLTNRGWAKSLKNRRKHYKILKQDFIVLFSLIN